MIQDTQLKERPICLRCKEHPAMGYYRDMLLCGGCLIHIQKLENNRLRSMYLEENNGQ